MDNKKVLGISIAAVVVLVIAIIATSYAAFTAQLTGTKENKLTTGYVKMNCAETKFNVSNTKAMTDAQGIAASGNVATCTLTSEMVGSMTVGYDVALYDVDSTSPSDALTKDNVKIQATKKIDSGSVQYLAGTSSSTGVTVGSIESIPSDLVGKLYDKSLTGYIIDHSTLTGNHSVLYSIKAWVASDAGASNTSSSNTSGVCSDPTQTSESACKAAGEIWGTSQTQTQAGSSFSFKLKIGATQVLS